MIKAALIAEPSPEARRAHFTPLTPTSFLPRAAAVYPQRISLIHGALRQTWKQTYQRCLRLASALRNRGIGHGDIVAVLAPNIPAMYEAHFGVPMAGAVVNTLNTRLKAEEIAFQLVHSGARMLLVDRGIQRNGRKGCRSLDKSTNHR